jgi:RNA polymerase sigma-70 factor (ECF subfamily)
MVSFPDVAAHRSAVVGHCYRMLGSAVEAEDAAQEALTRAWRNLDAFEGKASLRTWLYRIATNVCLDELAQRKRRIRPFEEGSPSNGAPALHDLVQDPPERFIEPIADARALPQDPAEQLALRESLRLAFVAALQTLPPKQRAALLLVDVLDFSAHEAAETLDTSVASLNSALQRARATMQAPDARRPRLTEPAAETVTRFVEAFERFDVDALAAMLRADATFSMPPYSLWLQGPEALRTWLNGLGSGCKGSRLLPTVACGLPAFAQYRADALRGSGGGHQAWALIVLEFSGDEIASWTSFLDTAALFPQFGLPLQLAAA